MAKVFKSTRYQTTEYNRSRRLLSRLRDIYGRARSFHWSHAQILDVLTKEVYSTADYAKLRPYYRGEFHGWRAALAEGLYNSLEWRVYLDGRLVPSAAVPDGQWCNVKGGEHVWKDAPDRIFSTLEPQNPPDLTRPASCGNAQSAGTTIPLKTRSAAGAVTTAMCRLAQNPWGACAPDTRGEIRPVPSATLQNNF